MTSNPHNKGFIALTSVIIIAAILLVVVVESSTANFATRFALLDAESKERSEALADACVDEVLVNLSADSTYAPTSAQTTTVGPDSCQVLTTTNPGASPRTYEIQGVFNQAYTDLLVSINVNTDAITSWQEVGHF